MLHLRLANATNRDATILAASVHPLPPPRLGLPDRVVMFQRYLAAGEEGLHESLQERHGEEYAQALIDGDPEIDLENVGRALPRASVVYLSSRGDVLYAAPQQVEVIINPDGSERERREPQDVPGNINDEAAPVRWTGVKLPKSEAVRKFVFQRSVQLRHVDGLTYDFLFAIAKELHDEGVMVLLGAGENGKGPLVFYANGAPYRGFLEGRVDGERYLLLLRLSNLELKRPSA